jgi:putative peptidoglycan lipid II flippase
MRRLAFITSLATILAIGKVLAFSKELSIAWVFGASSDVDIFLVAQIPLIFAIMFIGNVRFYMIPKFIEKKYKFDEKKAWEYIGSILSISIIVGIVFIVCITLFSNAFLEIVAPGFTQEQKIDTINSILILCIVPVLIILSGIFVGLLHANGYYYVSALSEYFPSLGIIIIMPLLSKTLGLYSLIISIAVAYLLQFIFLLLGSWRFRKSISNKTLFPRPYLVKTTYLNSIFIFLISIYLSVDFVVDRFFASYMAEGTIAILNYANKLAFIPVFTIGYAIMRTTLTDQAESFNKDIKLNLKEEIWSSLKLLLFYIIPILLFLFVFSKPVTSILFEHGFFSSEATIKTSNAVKIYSIAALFVSIVVVLVPTFIVTKKISYGVFAGIFGMLANVIVNIIMVEKYEYLGLALGTLAGSFIAATVLLVYSVIRFFEIEKLAYFIPRAVLAALITGFFCTGANKIYEDVNGENLILNNLLLLAMFILLVVVYLTVTHLLKISEIDYKKIIEKISKRTSISGAL